MELNGFFLVLTYRQAQWQFWGICWCFIQIKMGKWLEFVEEKRSKTFLIPEPSLYKPWVPHTWEPPELRLKLWYRSRGIFGKEEVKLQYPGSITKSPAAVNPCHCLPLPTCIRHSWFVFLIIPSSWSEQWLAFDRMVLPREGRLLPALFKPEHSGLWGTVMIFINTVKSWLWQFSIQNVALAAKFSQHCDSSGALQQCFGVGDTSTPFLGSTLSPQMSPTSNCFIKSLPVFPAWPKGKMLLPFNKSSLLYWGVYKNAEETGEGLKAITGNIFVAITTRGSSWWAIRSLMLLKSFVATTTGCSFYILDWYFCFFSPVFWRLDFWSVKYFTHTSRRQEVEYIGMDPVLPLVF